MRWADPGFVSFCNVKNAMKLQDFFRNLSGKIERSRLVYLEFDVLPWQSIFERQLSFSENGNSL